MGVTWAITRRNLTLFFRDPQNVFFSLLSALVVFVLYTLFLGNLMASQVAQAIPGAADSEVRGFIDAWMFAGIVSLSTLSTTLGAFSSFVEDASSGRFRDFLVSPIRRGQLVLGYMLAAFIVGVIITLIVFAVALIYLWLTSGVVLGIVEILRSIGWILLSTAGFTGLWALVVSFLRSTSAFSAVATIVGTVAGFVAGAYIAIGLFPSVVQSVVAALPFAQSAMLLRREFAAGPLSDLVGGNTAVIEQLEAFYGLSLHVGDWSVPVWFAAGVLAVMAVVFTALAAGRIRSRIV